MKLLLAALLAFCAAPARAGGAGVLFNGGGPQSLAPADSVSTVTVTGTGSACFAAGGLKVDCNLNQEYIGTGANISTFSNAGALTLASGSALTVSGANGNVIGVSSITTTGGLFGGSLTVTAGATIAGGTVLGTKTGALASQQLEVYPISGSSARSVSHGSGPGCFINATDDASAASRNWENCNDITAFGDYGIYQANAKGTIPDVSGMTAGIYFNASRQIGIGTTAQSTALSVYGVITSSTTQGSIACNAGTPALSATATDQHGTFTAGTAAANCTYTFGTAWPKTPDCVAIDDSSIIALRISAVSTTAVTVAGTTISGDTITFICMGAP